ncbi:unnamed protein product [Toxocara canis]|uniref:N-acetylgalactosaminide beta-1,3-galactosyltransferase n=1 Tax=Toxocara canis TaxID=6265 RepID=A0A183VD21_TOXCA|nr:unnamed protein product [Toxocara canis]
MTGSQYHSSRAQFVKQTWAKRCDKYFLNSMDANSPLYFGCHIRGLNGSPKQGYMSGGAGYVLSRTALRKFVTEAMKDPNKCHVNGYSEDVEVGVCLENVNVSTGDTRDEHKRHRFLPISLEKVLVWKENDAQAQWFQGYAVHQIKKGVKEVSDRLITVHYVTPEMMLVLDFLLYDVRRFVWHSHTVKVCAHENNKCLTA